ncbi:CLUMA_CG021197, isoform A [Clunio marinus]|uniref:CLUMA_CG021197, isoform A n=1 Tax=Clunio marinus TaxID=568069 RepID=A0A1J1J8T7_9DIPT|nr:CLUMA_CG021197, isoform A [Clunio marinus]
MTVDDDKFSIIPSFFPKGQYRINSHTTAKGRNYPIHAQNIRHIKEAKHGTTGEKPENIWLNVQY